MHIPPPSPRRTHPTSTHFLHYSVQIYSIPLFIRTVLIGSFQGEYLELLFSYPPGKRFPSSQTFNSHLFGSGTVLQFKVIRSSNLVNTMCEVTQVQFKCNHLRHTYRSWCLTYERSHKRCTPQVVAIEYRWVAISLQLLPDSALTGL